MSLIIIIYNMQYGLISASAPAACVPTAIATHISRRAD
jgi:hypothetical protein